MIASGGGAVKKKENMRAFYHNSIIVFLDRPVDNIVGDIEIKNRPLLANGPDVLYRLNDERYDLYNNQCHYRVENNKTLDELVDVIINIIKDGSLN